MKLIRIKKLAYECISLDIVACSVIYQHSSEMQYIYHLTFVEVAWNEHHSFKRWQFYITDTKLDSIHNIWFIAPIYLTDI